MTSQNGGGRDEALALAPAAPICDDQAIIEWRLLTLPDPPVAPRFVLTRNAARNTLPSEPSGFFSSYGERVGPHDPLPCILGRAGL